MYQYRNKTTALGLLLLLAMPLLFSVGILVNQKRLQLERHERLERESLQTITVPANKVYWAVKGKEIIIEGRLFDVKSYKTDGESISLTGYFDVKEDNLVNNIKNIAEQKSVPGNPLGHLAVKFLFAPVYNESISFSIQNPWNIINKEFRDYTEIVPQVSFSIHTPPPKFC